MLTPGPIEMRAGALIEYRLALHRIPVRWLTRIEEWTPGAQLRGRADARPLPALASHAHVHSRPTAARSCGDRVRYALPLGPLGELAHAALVRRDLERIFDYRQRRHRHDASQSKVRRLMATFWRLLGFLRPYRGGVIASFVLAAAAMGTGVLMPVPDRPAP